MIEEYVEMQKERAGEPVVRKMGFSNKRLIDRLKRIENG